MYILARSLARNIHNTIWDRLQCMARVQRAHTQNRLSLSVSPNQCGKLEQKVLQADLRVTLMAILVCGGVHMAQANQPTNVSTPIVKS